MQTELERFVVKLMHPHLVHGHTNGIPIGPQILDQILERILEQIEGSLHSCDSPDAKGESSLDFRNLVFNRKLSRFVFSSRDITNAPSQMAHSIPLVLVASSRLGRHPENHPSLFDQLRTIASRRTELEQKWLLVPGSSIYKYAKRCCELFQIAYCDLKIENDLSLENWFLSLGMESSAAKEKFQSGSVNVSPILDLGMHHVTGISSSFNRDEIAAIVADEMYALKVSPKGNTINAIEHRLRLQKPTMISANDQLVSAKVRNRLLKLGATETFFFQRKIQNRNDSRRRPHNGTLNASDVNQNGSAAKRNSVLKTSECLIADRLVRGQFLTHCTRARSGPWPEDSQNQFLDDLIFSRPSSNHESFAALIRILIGRQLLGDNLTVRGATKVVCFSELLPHQLVEKSTFRSHLCRWDYEPYGVCIRREVIERLGGRPAIYGDEQTWRQLSEDQKALFQKESSGSGNRYVNWRSEREWRVAGNIDLEQIAAEDMILFVENAQEATEIRNFSKWQVCVVG